MPSANTKPVAARIPKDHYYLLLREAAERQMTISRFLEDVVIKSYLTPKKAQKVENGGMVDIKQKDSVKPTKCIVFDEFPDVLVRNIGTNYSMHTIGKDDTISVGTIGKKIANGTIVFEGYDISFTNLNEWSSRNRKLKTREVELEIVWNYK
jgi:hypothetical protein